MHVSRRETQEEFFGHTHEVFGEPQDTPGVLDEQRLTVATAQTPRLEKAAEPDVKPPETPATGEPRPGSNPTLRATCFCSTGSVEVSLRTDNALLFHYPFMEELRTIRPLVPVNTTALLGMHGLILPL